MSYSSYDFYKTHYFFEIEMKEKIIQKSSIIISAFTALLIANANMFIIIFNKLLKYKLINKNCTLEISIFLLYIVFAILVILLLLIFFKCFYHIYKTIHLNKEYEYLNKYDKILEYENKLNSLNPENNIFIEEELNAKICERYVIANLTNSKNNSERHNHFLQSLSTLKYILTLSFALFVIFIIINI